MTPDGIRLKVWLEGTGQSLRLLPWRKVRTPQGGTPANGREEQSYGKCHRKYTAYGPSGPGKGEMVG